MGKAELKIEIDADLLARAAASGLSIEATLEAALKTALADYGAAHARAERWARDNAEALRAHRERIEKFGPFGDDLRTW
jgi:antitoxin CcdA